MQPISQWPLAARQKIHGVMTDIDDTLTTDGQITEEVQSALVQLQSRGLRTVAITGRPAGWCAPFVGKLALDAIVAENGAVAFIANPQKGAPSQKIYLQDEATRTRNFQAMQAVTQRILASVEGAQIAQDSAGRECDIAIDHSEFTQLSAQSIDDVVKIMQAAGMTATVSSIHINGWFGSHNKWEGGRWILRELWQQDLASELEHWAYIGDSTNDERMFEHFDNSIGVANIARFAPHMQFLPRFVTQAERGHGFAEMTQHLLQAQATGAVQTKSD